MDLAEMQMFSVCYSALPRSPWSLGVLPLMMSEMLFPPPWGLCGSNISQRGVGFAARGC